MSRRMTRTGQPAARAAARTRASNVRPPSFNAALSRPIRVLNPPAGRTTSTADRDVFNSVTPATQSDFQSVRQSENHQ